MTGSPTGRKAARYQTSFTVGENQPCPVWSKMSPTMSRMKDRIGNTTFGCSSPLLCPQLHPHPEWQVVLASMIQSVFIIPMQRTEDILQLDCVLQIWGLACRADSFDRVVDRIHDEAFGQLHDRDFYMIHTIGLVTNLTVEMDMPVSIKHVSVSLRQISYFIDPLPSSKAWMA